MTNKNNLLQLMGITTWQLRDNNTTDDHYFRVVFNNTDGKSVGLLLADVDHVIALSDQENLLQKIAEALTPNFHRDVISAITLDDMQKKNYTFIILLGNKISLPQLNCRVIKSFSLPDLIQNTAYKKQLWSDIKSLREFFA